VKFDPVMEIVDAPPPAVALDGLIEVIVGPGTEVVEVPVLIVLPPHAVSPIASPNPAICMNQQDLLPEK